MGLRSGRAVLIVPYVCGWVASFAASVAELHGLAMAEMLGWLRDFLSRRRHLEIDTLKYLKPRWPLVTAVFHACGVLRLKFGNPPSLAPPFMRALSPAPQKSRQLVHAVTVAVNRQGHKWVKCRFTGGIGQLSRGSNLNADSHLLGCGCYRFLQQIPTQQKDSGGGVGLGRCCLFNTISSSVFQDLYIHKLLRWCLNLLNFIQKTLCCFVLGSSRSVSRCVFCWGLDLLCLDGVVLSYRTFLVLLWLVNLGDLLKNISL
uniref:Secreted protein n=1 Tax=Knipowitschia caucasica TaxID=637954 RepID=A0AAV2JMU5_KNICA